MNPKPKKTKLTACVHCRKAPPSEDREIFPFCSERCKMLDLGAWTREDYRIAGEKKDLSEVPPIWWTFS